MNEGYIKLYRSLLKWEWIDTPNVLVLFVHCLLRANYQDTKWHGIEIKRGELITSYSKLAKFTGLSVQQVRTSLDKLKETGEVVTKSQQGSKHTIIRVCNYDKYQGQQTFNKEITKYQQSGNKVVTTDNNIKNINNINNTPNSNYIYNAREGEDDFEDFKVAKKVRLSVK